MKFQFIGCGDAFGSGGRFNTCFHVTGRQTNFLIDCGATSLVALKRLRVALNDIQTIVITHYHADHFDGVPAFLLDAQFFSKRTEPLTIVGPHELRDQFVQASENAYPGSSKTKHRFDLRFIELTDRETHTINGLALTPYLVKHGNPGGPFFGYRIDAEGRIIAYTGDTEWVDCLVDIGRDADLFVAEAYFRTKRVPFHLDLASLEERLDEIHPKRLILTHMSDDMLKERENVPYECAEDGLIVEL